MRPWSSLVEGGEPHDRHNSQTWMDGAVVVAQLVERLLPKPEVCGSIPVIGKMYIDHLLTCLLSTALKYENQQKEARSGPLLKNKSIK